MERVSLWVRNSLAVVGLLALGYWLGASVTVKASNSPSSDLEFQLTGINETSSLLVYQPGTKTVYVYRGATTGNSYLQCSFMFQLGKPGSPIQRVPCEVGSLVP